MKPTFNQIAAGALSFILIVVLTGMHFHPVQGDGMVQGALISMLVACGHFLFGSTTGSQSKDEAQAAEKTQLIDAVKNSTPVIPDAPKNA